MKKLRILLALITESNDFQLEQAATAADAAQDLGVELEIVYADGDTITQSTQILKSIQVHSALQPSGILVEPAGGTGLPQVAKAAAAAGIAWGLLNREAEYIGELRQNSKAPVFVVTSDHKEIGRIQARQLGALLPGGGAALYITGPTESGTVKDRRDGFESVCPRGIQTTLLRGKWTQESSQQSVTAWLKLGMSAKAGIGAIVGQNDAMAIGARKAFDQVASPEEKQKLLSLPFLGADGLPKTGQNWVRSGLLAATVVAPPMGGLAVRLLTQALRSGTRPPERTVTTLESYPAIEKLAKLQLAGAR